MVSATLAFTNIPFVTHIEKPWGYEILFTPGDRPYAGKLFLVKAGYRLSLQVHSDKHETIVLVSGQAQLQADDAAGKLETIDMQRGMGYSNVPGQRHRLIALEDCEFFEASSPEVGMTYRLEDDHGRGHETEDLRARPDRGWSAADTRSPG